MKIKKDMKKELKSKKVLDEVLQYAKEYIDEAQTKNVYPTKKALKKLKKFEESMPQKGTKTKKVLKTLQENGKDNTVMTTGGRYFGFVIGSYTLAGLGARMMSDVWDQNPAMNVLSPISGKLESVVQSWLVELFGLPKGTVAGFLSGSSMAIFCALAAARWRVMQNLGHDVNKKGLINAPKIRVVTSEQIHGTVLKGLALLGLGSENIEFVPCDEQGRVLAKNMPKLDNTCIVILQAGNVCSGAFDEFGAICKEAKKAGAWVHVDGAFGLWVAASKKLAHLAKGANLANSFSLDAHKTLNTPYDNAVVLCTDEEALTSALHQSGSYIVNDGNRDGMYYTPEMSRRARAIELWATMKYLGKEGIDELVYSLHKRASQFAKEIKKAGFEVCNDVAFNQVMIRYKDEKSTKAVIQNVQKSGVCWAGLAKWRGADVIRISVSSWVTSKGDITKSVGAFKEAARRI